LPFQPCRHIITKWRKKPSPRRTPALTAASASAAAKRGAASAGPLTVLCRKNRKKRRSTSPFLESSESIHTPSPRQPTSRVGSHQRVDSTSPHGDLTDLLTSDRYVAPETALNESDMGMHETTDVPTDQAGQVQSKTCPLWNLIGFSSPEFFLNKKRHLRTFIQQVPRGGSVISYASAKNPDPLVLSCVPLPLRSPRSCPWTVRRPRQPHIPSPCRTPSPTLCSPHRCRISPARSLPR